MIVYSNEKLRAGEQEPNRCHKNNVELSSCRASLFQGLTANVKIEITRDVLGINVRSCGDTQASLNRNKYNLFPTEDLLMTSRPGSQLKLVVVFVNDF
jgi:hypothetical protein